MSVGGEVGEEVGEIFEEEVNIADKIKLTPQQIAKACKIDQCAPR